MASLRRRRWWLVVLAVVSLVFLVFSGVTAAFSTPVTDEMERANRLPGAAGPAVGTRALAVPLSDVTLVPTFQNGLDATLGHNGSFLLAGNAGALFPANAENVTLARALAYVAPTANGSYVPATLEFVGLPAAAGTESLTIDKTVDVMELARGGSGFLVKGDREQDVRFVPRERVLGMVARFDPSSALTSALAVGGIGFLAPVVILIATHRPKGKPGIGGEGLCPECREPTRLGGDFCTRCGAWLKEAARR